jgi:transcriptional regulator with XRE-family HTH domain
MSLTDVSERSGMTRAAVSKLENGWNLNPTLETLVRYASSVDATLTVSILDHVSRRGGK